MKLQSIVVRNIKKEYSCSEVEFLNSIGERITLLRSAEIID